MDTPHTTPALLQPAALSQPAVASSQDDRHGQLLDLVGELLQANQELRFKVAQLEQKADRTARTLAESAAVYGLLLP
jgi:hypothetical protein